LGQGGECLLEEDWDVLERPFSRKDVEIVIFGMKTETAPGPNGFTVFFSKAYTLRMKL
jgi:hypothetical protein